MAIIAIAQELLMFIMTVAFNMQAVVEAIFSMFEVAVVILFMQEVFVVLLMQGYLYAQSKQGAAAILR